MKKITFEFKGTVTLNVESGEDFQDIISEVEISHPDNTRVSDYSIDDLICTESR